LSYKHDILQAASRLFAEKGFKEASIADLSRLSGAAEGTIFYHFKSKEDILVSLLEKVKEDIILEVEKYKRPRGNGLAMVEEGINFYLSLSEKMENEFLLLFRNYPYQLASIHPACRESIEGIYNCFIDMFIESIEAGQKDGSVRQGHSTKLALLLFSMINGLVRFDYFNLFPLHTVYSELMEVSQRILAPDPCPQMMKGAGDEDSDR
jgi:AcrR family transcriptional regulator